jgi:hypothetical protein
MTMDTKALFDSGASACFIDNELVWQHKMIIVKKSMPITMEIIDG